MGFTYENKTNEPINIGGYQFNVGQKLESNIDITTLPSGACFADAIAKGLLSVNGVTVPSGKKPECKSKENIKPTPPPKEEPVDLEKDEGLDDEDESEDDTDEEVEDDE